MFWKSCHFYQFNKQLSFWHRLKTKFVILFFLHTIILLTQIYIVYFLSTFQRDFIFPFMSLIKINNFCLSDGFTYFSLSPDTKGGNSPLYWSHLLEWMMWNLFYSTVICWRGFCEHVIREYGSYISSTLRGINNRDLVSRYRT